MQKALREERDHVQCVINMHFAELPHCLGPRTGDYIGHEQNELYQYNVLVQFMYNVLVHVLCAGDTDMSKIHFRHGT